MCFYDLITLQCDPTHFRWEHSGLHAPEATGWEKPVVAQNLSSQPTGRSSHCQSVRHARNLRRMGRGRQKSNSAYARTQLQHLGQSAKGPERYTNLSQSQDQRRHSEWLQKIKSKHSASSIRPPGPTPEAKAEDIREVFDMVVLGSMIKGLIANDGILRLGFDRASIALWKHAQPQQRLFEITSAPGSMKIHGRFYIVELSDNPTYAALSYTWGDIGSQRMIMINEKKLAVGENLWYFLRHRTTEDLASHQFLWIDAICINQQDVRERNHQVSLMGKIYLKASVVVIWLGRESYDSNVAMEYVAKKGLIIQEILNAQQIVVICSTKRFEWREFEGLYLKVKVLDLRGWISHHEFAPGLLEGPAITMVWQRAHYLHPDTPAPLLQELIEVFQDWQCSDSRDKDKWVGQLERD
ncbi:hypothetical protein G7Y89_g6796 [Cudoniella acicularis]|uniref:Heterokaryon incompatibility domain-containing protein n=1 Tax=Cudoniella acicularis TaxID=354080 RepID=A0A8H4RKL4_9HELO|nr:hypothetical protein G7Y89_g6796 [Cudoniella acicularis]